MGVNGAIHPKMGFRVSLTQKHGTVKTVSGKPKGEWAGAGIPCRLQKKNKQKRNKKDIKPTKRAGLSEKKRKWRGDGDTALSSVQGDRQDPLVIHKKRKKKTHHLDGEIIVRPAPSSSLLVCRPRGRDPASFSLQLLFQNQGL